MNFSEWITRKCVEWRGDRIGSDISIEKFGELFGASHQVISLWMTKPDVKPRSHKYITALVAKYGEEVYDILGYPKPQEKSPYSAFPPGMRERLLAAQREVETELARLGLTGNSQEAERIAIEILGKHGFKYNATSTSGN